MKTLIKNFKTRDHYSSKIILLQYIKTKYIMCQKKSKFSYKLKHESRRMVGAYFPLTHFFEIWICLLPLPLKWNHCLEHLRPVIPICTKTCFQMDYLFEWVFFWEPHLKIDDCPLQFGPRNTEDQLLEFKEQNTTKYKVFI